MVLTYSVKFSFGLNAAVGRYPLKVSRVRMSVTRLSKMLHGARMTGLVKLQRSIGVTSQGRLWADSSHIGHQCQMSRNVLNGCVMQAAPAVRMPGPAWFCSHSF
ncbi:hypothetical protein [Shimia sp.]|uniref:hypothetical protein n=1 Tax=Shimia sp. TaxID=1954381 RepID=UPI003296C214